MCEYDRWLEKYFTSIGKVAFVRNCMTFSFGKNYSYIQLNAKWIKFPNANVY